MHVCVHMLVHRDLVLDTCVQSSALHGAEMGFDVSVIEDACRPLDQANVPAVKAELAQAGVAIVTAAEAKAQVSAIQGQHTDLRTVLGRAKKCKSAKSLHLKMAPIGAHRPPSESVGADQ